MREARAIIQRVRRISATLQRLEVAVQEPHADIGPGQILLARTTNTYDPYLREPWVPVEKQGRTLVIERPAAWNYSPSQDVNLIGPVCKPIPLRDSIRALLLIAYESSPAITLMLAGQIIARGGAVTLALIGQARHYPVEALPAEIEVVRAAEHTGWTDRLTALRWADQIVAVAPPPLDVPVFAKLLDDVRMARVEIAADFLYGLFQPPMPCGVGACQACVVQLNGGDDSPACIDGPAYDLRNVNLAVRTPGGQPNE